MFQRHSGQATVARKLESVYRLFVCVVATFLLSAGIASGQQPPTTDSAGKQAARSPAEKFKRWFEIDGLTLSVRYRLIRNAAGVTVGNAGQFNFAGRGHFKFDKKGKYSVYMGLFTGNNMVGGWNNTGWGTGDTQTNLHLKQLYFDAKPVKGLEIQIGGIGLNNGENTEITGYDNDAYLTGERIAVRLPKKLYFDEVSVANGYIGDLTRPGIFGRLKHLNRSNYHQFLVRKQLNKHVSFSADYTFEAGRDTLHQAVKFKVPKSRILDTVLFENYERLDPFPGYGFGLYGEKAVHKKFILGGGFARVDRPSLNGDRFPQGNRIYGSAVWKPTREFTLSSILIEGLGPMPSPASNRTRFELIFGFNILETLRRYKLH